MQILDIIFTIVFIIANAAMTYFAVTAWFELRRTKRNIINMSRAIAITTTITMGEHVRDNFEQLNKMKASLHRLVENEQYEEAEKLRVAIVKTERIAESALKQFKDICGDNLCEVIVTNVKSSHNEEE